LFNKYNVSKSKCLGHCENGPTIAIYPDGHIFRKVTPTDVPQIIDKFLK
jgi:(2Fe-2S) ferredoxin